VLKDLDAGSYRLTVVANGFARQDYGTKLPSVQGTPISLAVGQTLRDIVVRVLPTGNITGRISDENARPAVGVTVQLMRAIYNPNGQRTLQSAGQTRTNDRGEYRLFWVTPGRYYLNAGPGVGLVGLRLSGAGDSQNGFQESYTSTFYPGVADVKAANTIEVQPGIELSGIDLRVARQQLYRIRGRVIDSTTGDRPAAVSLSLASRGIADTGGIVQTITQSYNPSDGTFEIKDMMPGVYGITAQTADTMALGLPRTDGPPRPAASAAVTVSDADVNVVLTLTMGVSLPGRLIVEGEEISRVSGLDRVRVQLSNVEELFTGGFQRSPQAQPVSPTDGTFRENNALPGQYRVAVTQLPPDFYVKDARFNQTDVLSRPLQFSGSVSSSLEVVLSARGGQLEGTVTDEKRQPAAGVSAVLIPGQYRDRADLYKAAVTDQNGHFLIRGITPGEYKAFAWEALEPFAYFDSELLRRYEALGKSVRIAESDKSMADLKLIPLTQ
jgi:hypothetical protein